MQNKWEQSYDLYKRYLRSISLVYNKRQDVRVFVEVFLSLIAIMIFGIFAIKPTLVTIAGLTTEIKGKKDTVSQMDTKIENLVTAQKNYTSQAANLSLLYSAIPNESYQDYFSEQIEGVASKNGVSVSTYTFSESTKGEDNTGTFEVNISVGGSYESLVSFLRDLEALRRPISFVDTSFNVTTSTTGSSSELILNISGVVSFFESNFLPKGI